MSVVATLFIVTTILAYFILIAGFIYFLSMLYTGSVGVAMILKASVVSLVQLLFQNYTNLIYMIYSNIQFAEGLYT